MQVPSATTPTTAQAVTTQAAHSNTVNYNSFLQLLVTQLKNQDPTSPQSNTEFIAQLATFSSLEQLTSINKGVTAMAQVFDTTASGAGTAQSNATTADATQSA